MFLSSVCVCVCVCVSKARCAKTRVPTVQYVSTVSVCVCVCVGLGVQRHVRLLVLSVLRNRANVPRAQEHRHDISGRPRHAR